ncbi:SUMF1/EgtB/PvdO family nonheme iron enzyme [Desulfoluna sp.]|uniref:SUMF1/EgtB/PvdO family nonheme iron enzyme n=1 Tax=Desulfoluna sp. TaxID=2045199 RepID=UPI00260672F9|nr:SUMF1/EgtB/PvdO family nonheme iron enzyme [Desulfoluna sp.]
MQRSSENPVGIMGSKQYSTRYEGVTMKEMKVSSKARHRWYWLPVFLGLGLGMIGCSDGGGRSSNDMGSDNEPPSLSQPQAVIMAQEESSVNLSWEAVPGATHYTVYWSEESDTWAPVKDINRSVWTPIKGIKGTTWVHANTCLCRQLYYVVVAEDGTHSSHPSETLSMTPKVGELQFPKHFKAVSGDAGITVNWDAVPCARSYTVYWSDDPLLYEREWQTESNIKGTEWVHTGLEYDKTYYYDISVTGKDKVVYSNSGDRVDATAKAGTLQSPQKVFAKPVDGGVELTWGEVAGAELYTLYWSKNQDAGIDSENVVETTKRSFTVVGGLEKNSTYYFVVVASEGIFESAPSASVSAFFLGDPIKTKTITITLSSLTGPIDVDFKFAELPKGSFWMGSPESEPNRKNNEDLHEVALTNAFYLMTTEVTQGQWEAVVGENPSLCQTSNNIPPKDLGWMTLPGTTYPADSSGYPVENVYLVGQNVVDEESGEEKFVPGIKEFIDKLNEKSIEYTFRLPTDAEWEYAARAGTGTPYAIGDGHEVNEGDLRFRGSIKDWPGTCKAESFSPNPWGFYNMHGNVNEWVADAWRNNLGDVSQVDPFHAMYLDGEEKYHCTRGGGYSNSAKEIRSAYRHEMKKTGKNVWAGFRLAADEKDE